MKKVISFILITILIFANLNISLGEENVTQYDGLDIYRTVFDNINFNDVNNHWAKKYINKMSALSIIKGMGNNNFSPNNTLSIEHSIILLSRLLGLEDEAHKLGEDSIGNVDTGSYKILNSYDYWVRGYVDTALNNNIMTKEEYNELTTFTENEQYSIDDAVSQRLSQYESDFNLSQTQLDNIEKQLREKEERRLSIGQPITRERLAVWVSRIINLEPISGRDQQLVFKLKDWEQIDTKNIPIIEAIIKERIMVGNDNNEFKPKGYLTRGEMSTVLDNISEKILESQGFIIEKGLVKKIEEINELYKDNITNKNININKKEFLINTDNNENIKISSQSSPQKINEKGFIVYKNNSLSMPNAIKELDYVKYYINPEGKVVLVEVLDDNLLEIEGLVEEVDDVNKTLTLKDFNGNIHTFKVANGATISVNNIPLELKELLYGQEIKVKVNNSNVLSVIGYLEEGPEGYINPGDKVVSGEVLYAGNDFITILKNGEELEYKIDENTSVLKDNSYISPSRIKEGDTVRLEFNEYNTEYPSVIYASSIDKPITNVYKGSINYYNSSTKDLILDNLKYYSNGNWETKNNTSKIALNYDIDLYKDGKKISLSDLNKYSGSEIFIVCEDYFGKEKGIKGVIKSDYETIYNDKLQDISFGLNTLTIDYDDVEFNYDSTIVIKDNRLVHPYNLEEKDTLYVVTEGLDYPKASFIAVDEVPKTDLVIYRGKIIDILKYGFELEDYEMYYNNNYYNTTSDKNFKITNDTKIIDTRDEYSEVTVEDFNNQRFLQNKYYNPDSLYNKYAFVVEQNGIVTALNIIDSNTEIDILSSSEIEKIDLSNNKITINNVKDWNNLNKKWTNNNSTFDLDVKEAMIIKDGKAIKLYEVSKGDSLYIYRKNNYGYVVIVK